ncbi:hypothetical protein L218DRAFT_721462, partial [Marasmius fiardii PR-910]
PKRKNKQKNFKETPKHRPAPRRSPFQPHITSPSFTLTSSAIMNILGWTPDNGEDGATTPSFNQLITLDLHQSHPDQTRSSASDSPSPASATSTIVPESSGSQTPRRGDPDWVARPRNCFFIFRCDYIKHHSRGGRGASSPGSSELGLSKRAGQAWRCLSPKVKAEYERKADEERIQHARDHPNYRYRPTRSDLSRRRHDKPHTRRAGNRAPSSISPSTTSSRRHVEGPVMMRAQTDSPSSPPAYDSSSPFGSLQPPGIHPEELIASRRRSLSVPPLFNPYHYPHPHFGGMPHELRRTTSNQETNLPMAGQTSHMSPTVSQEFMYPEVSTPRGHGSEPIPGHQSPYQHPGDPGFVYHATPLTAVSSSLANWNSISYHQSYTPPLSMPLLSQSWSADSFLSTTSSPDGSSSQIHSPTFANTSVVNPEHGIEYMPDERPAITHEFPHFGSSEHSTHDTPMGEYSSDEAARANALENFEMGLADRGSQMNGEYMSFDMSLPDEQKLFDGMVML